MKKILLSFAIISLLVSCVPAQEEAKKTGTGFTFNKPGGAPILPTRASLMTLVSPASSSGFDSTPTFLLSGVVSGETVKIYANAGCTSELGSAVASGSTVSITSDPLGIGSQNFYTKSINSIGQTSCSGLMTTYTYLGVAPVTATSMTLQSPATSPNTDSTPTFTLSGVLAGETVKIYTNATCSTEVGTAVAAGTSVNITSSALAPGTYTFYTRSVNNAGSGSCSSAMVTYEYLGVLPTSGSSISMINPTNSSDYDSTPTIKVFGVANGDTVKVYTDSGCTTQVASALATGTSVEMTTSALTAGINTFYTNSTNVIGTSACSAALIAYEYLGPSPTVQVSWTANKETAVNSTGGGYRVYYSTTSGFNTATASYVDVPYAGGASTPTTANITGLMVGTYYFKVVAYSSMNQPGQTSGGSTSAASAQFQISLP